MNTKQLFWLTLLIGVRSICYAGADSLHLKLERVDLKTGERYYEYESIATKNIAIYVVDMWDTHACETHARWNIRMIPKMNDVLNAARAKNIRVVFSPAGVVNYYKDYAQRKTVLGITRQAAPSIPSVQQVFRSVDSSFRARHLDSNYHQHSIYACTINIPPHHLSGCECGPERPCFPRPFAHRQHEDLIIESNDLIVNGDDRDEIYSVLTSNEITHVMYVGAAANMCVTYTRQGSALNLIRMGFKAIFIEDLLNSITGRGYNPELDVLDPSFTPDRGHKEVMEHLKRYYAPAISSDQLLGAETVFDQRMKQLEDTLSTVESDFEKTILLREFAASHTDWGISASNVKYQMKEGFWNMSLRKIFNVFEEDLATAFCGMTGAYLHKLYERFGFKSYTYDMGNKVTGITHFVTLVEIDCNGSKKLVVHDPSVNLTYVDSMGAPKDFYEMLSELKERKSLNIQIKTGNYWFKPTYLTDSPDIPYGSWCVNDESEVIRTKNRDFPYGVASARTLTRFKEVLGERYATALSSVGLPEELIYLFLMPIKVGGAEGNIISERAKFTLGMFR